MFGWVVSFILLIIYFITPPNATEPAYIVLIASSIFAIAGSISNLGITIKK